MDDAVKTKLVNEAYMKMREQQRENTMVLASNNRAAVTQDDLSAAAKAWADRDAEIRAEYKAVKAQLGVK